MQAPSKVKLSKITIKNVKGTSATQVAVKLVCSRDFPCEEVTLSDIDVTYSGPEGPAISQCSNVKPTISGKENPKICSAPVPTAAPGGKGSA